MWQTPATELAPAEFLSSVGRIFAHFDQQDSGNISFGVAAAGAPEEFEKGQVIDERTTVFTLGRTAAIFLEDWSENGSHRALPHGAVADSVRTVTEIACAPDPAARYPSVAALAEAFDAAMPT